MEKQARFSFPRHWGQQSQTVNLSCSSAMKATNISWQRSPPDWKFIPWLQAALIRECLTQMRLSSQPLVPRLTSLVVQSALPQRMTKRLGTKQLHVGSALKFKVGGRFGAAGPGNACRSA